MSCIPQGLVLGLVLFNMFDGEMDSVNECTPSKFADYTKLYSAINKLERRNTIWMNLDRSDSWAHARFIMFNKAKST